MFGSKIIVSLKQERMLAIKSKKATLRKQKLLNRIGNIEYEILNRRVRSLEY